MDSSRWPNFWYVKVFANHSGSGFHHWFLTQSPPIFQFGFFGVQEKSLPKRAEKSGFRSYRNTWSAYVCQYFLNNLTLKRKLTLFPKGKQPETARVVFLICVSLLWIKPSHAALLPRNHWNGATWLRNSYWSSAEDTWIMGMVKVGWIFKSHGFMENLDLHGLVNYLY